MVVLYRNVLVKQHHRATLGFFHPQLEGSRKQITEKNEQGRGRGGNVSNNRFSYKLETNCVILGRKHVVV